MSVKVEIYCCNCGQRFYKDEEDFDPREVENSEYNCPTCDIPDLEA